MTFWIGLALTVTALVVWVVLGRRPRTLRTFDDGHQVLAPPSKFRLPPSPDDVVDVRCVATTPAPSVRLADVLPGHQLAVTRDGPHWIISDDEGRVAHVGLPGAGPNDPAEAVTPRTSHLPDRGTLWVDRVLQDAEGRTLDLRGPVHAEPASADDPET